MRKFAFAYLERSGRSSSEASASTLWKRFLCGGEANPSTYYEPIRWTALLLEQDWISSARVWGDLGHTARRVFLTLQARGFLIKKCLTYTLGLIGFVCILVCNVEIVPR